MTTADNWRLGLATALTTAFMWGFLPIVLHILLQDGHTSELVFIRFLFAAVGMALLFLMRTPRQILIPVNKQNSVWMVLGTLGLAGNYFTYMYGLSLIPASIAQVTIQLAPVFFILVSWKFLNEKSYSIQYWGLGILIVGFFLFYFDKLTTASSALIPGIVVITCSAVLWTLFAFAQKKALKSMNGNQFMFVMYLGSTILFSPWYDGSHFFSMSSINTGLLLFACINTLIAYGAFSKSISVWDGSRASAVLAITPLLTLFGSWLTWRLFPNAIGQDNHSVFNLIGALLVVTGCALAALGKGRVRQQKAANPAHL